MTRVNKKTRIKGLPAKLQTQQQDNKSGSYPTRVRIASDNRTGMYKTHWDDTSTIVFDSTANLELGAGISSGSQYITYPSEQLTDISITGSVRKGVGDQIANSYTFISGQGFEPFKEVYLAAVDGKSSGSSFYATGSVIEDVGEGFNSPLWSKSKIEIDISVGSDVTQSLDIRAQNDAISQSYQMCYYNFTNKTWDGIGNGFPLGINLSNKYDKYLDQFMMGFTPSIMTINTENARGTQPQRWRTGSLAGFEYQKSAGRPFTNLGFPYHPKFHATSSQLFNTSNVISKPFLLEKVVIQIDAKYVLYSSSININTFTGSFEAETITHITESALPACINNVFILNQRNHFSLTDFEEDFNPNTTNTKPVINIPAAVTLSAGAETTSVSSVRELVTYGGISSIAANVPSLFTRSGSYKQPRLLADSFPIRTENIRKNLKREFNFEINTSASFSLNPLSWSGSLSLELPVVSPNKIGKGFDQVSYFKSHSDGAERALQVRGTRSGLGLLFPFGRDWLSPVTSVDLSNTVAVGNSFLINVPKNSFSKTNPYLLLPGDNLVIGWQQPIPMATDVYTQFGEGNVASGSFSSIIFPKGEAKVILYGSEIENNQEKHETLNQLLTSNAIHEVIGND